MSNLRNLWFLPPMVCLLVACATSEAPMQVAYSGPVATIADTASSERRERARIFAVVSVDGKTIPNAISESRRASAGMGSVIVPTVAERRVPARQIKIKLIGTHQSGAAIAEVLYRAAGQFQSVEGEISFTPAVNASYVVVGELAPDRSCVWLELAGSKTPASEKVCTK